MSVEASLPSEDTTQSQSSGERIASCPVLAITRAPALWDPMEGALLSRLDSPPVRLMERHGVDRGPAETTCLKQVPVFA